MRTRVLAVTGLLALLAPAYAQNAPANGPAAAPAGNAPAASAQPPGPVPASGKKVAVRVPTGGEYTAYVGENRSAAPKTLTEKVDLDLPASGKATVYVLDNKSGYAARKPVDTKAPPAELAFDSRDFVLLQKLKITATGKDDRPIAGGRVTVTDGGKNNFDRVLRPSDAGTAEFAFVRAGAGSVMVTADDGVTVANPITIGLNPGEQVQTVVVPLPQVTATVEPAGGSAPPPSTEAATGSDAASNTPVAPTEPAPAAPAADGGSGLLQNVIAWILLAGVLGAGYMYLKNRGVTVDSALKKLGIQPDTVAANGGSLAGANLAGPGGAAPGPPPPPPPVVSDPNQCPYCGQMKDAAGQCSCSITPGGTVAPAAAAPSGSGPRLVGMAGTYMGSVFPLGGLAVIGREPTNPVPLDRDTTASRRHAQITEEGGAFRVQDLGSSNGTFVNGARVEETVLQPGDEVAIGGTRFRFEV